MKPTTRKVTAALLALSEWRGTQGRNLRALTWLDALWIWLGQATAIAPGISRSGATMAAGLVRGVRRALGCAAGDGGYVLLRRQHARGPGPIARHL